MKKLIAFIFAIVMFVCCASGRYISTNEPQAAFDAEQVLYTTRPELVPYYEAGVLKITSLREKIGRDGIATYDIRYKFVRRYIRDYVEKMACLQEHYPELYQMYVSGVIDVGTMYRYVDDYGNIRYHVSYRRLYEYYYDYVPLPYPYGGYRYYHYRPRVAPPPRVREPQPQPKPDVRPNDRNRHDGGRTPRQGGNPNVSPNRGSNPPAGGNRGGNNSRPSTTPRQGGRGR